MKQGIFLILSLLNLIFTQKMDVFIQNSPYFYYSHKCQVTFTVISTKFNQPNSYFSELFMIKIIQSSFGTRFLEYFVPPLIHVNNQSKIDVPVLFDSCDRGRPTSIFFCVFIPSTSSTRQSTRIVYNLTHYMYRFTLTNIVCPTEDILEEKRYHVKFQIDIPENQASSKIQMTGNYTFKFENLRYRLIKEILVNPTPIQNDSSYRGFSEYEGFNFISGSKSLVSFIMDVSNYSEINDWETFSITFSQPITDISLDTSTCKVATSTIQTFQMSTKVTSNTSAYCDFSILSNSLVFKNPSYFGSYCYNSIFNKYQMYDPLTPGIRFNFTITVNFLRQSNINLYPKLTATTDCKINDFGLKEIIQTEQATIYSNLRQPKIFNSLSVQNFNKIDQRYRKYPINMKEQDSNKKEDVFILNLRPYSGYILLGALGVILLTLLARKKAWQWEQNAFTVFLLTQMFMKLVILIIYRTGKMKTSVSTRQIQGFIELCLIMQYAGFGSILFIVYWMYHFLMRRKDGLIKLSGDRLEKRRDKSIIFYMLLMFNYKFYYFATFHRREIIIFKMKVANYPNHYFNKKFSFHLLIESFLILFQIFFFLQLCPNPIISIVHTTYQMPFLYLMSVMSKSAYWRVQWKKRKDKRVSRLICEQNQEIVENNINQLKEVTQIKSQAKSLQKIQQKASEVQDAGTDRKLENAEIQNPECS